ncbi:OppA family ABC transporter substrate-binding lipoprotein [Mycoplasma miroungirhinis]|uniref:Lipoprotein n=1 Tax=Mycoplasma miroungirhinis TaxID=754516 RepID=A0A6M4JD29_9MOLU|nr:hypothetical protein [Mycoplasma miroungirhinis]QJR43946.1 hypothetical protein HLA92_00590 [Mycoplasma miroungirhinis]
MIIKNKKFKFIVSGILLSTGVTVLSSLVAAACSSKIVTVSERRTYSQNYNNPNSLSGFDYDGSIGYGSEQQTSKDLQVSLKLIKLKPLNEASVSYEYKKDDFSIVTKINKPSFWKYKFYGAKAVLLTLKDGTVKVFDKDTIEDLDTQTNSKNPDGTFSSLYVQAFSNDPRSINSKEFLNNLNNIKKLQLIVRETPWVTSEGELTKYKTKADDYWYSWMRTVLRSQRTRLKYGNGSNQELEKEMNSLLPAGTRRFTTNDLFPNQYVYDLFNVKASDFYDREKLITKIESENEYKGQEALTFNPLDESESIFGSEFFNSFAKSNDFAAAPSDYIKEKIAQKDIKITSYTEKSPNDLLAKITTDDFLKTNVGKFGVFWYGMNTNNTLFAGPYYAEGFKQLKEIFKQNPYFFDQEWVKSNESIKVIENIYKQSVIDPGLYDQQQWQNYRAGTTTRIAYQSLNQQTKNIINENVHEYGLRSRQDVNKTSLISRVLLQPVPGSFETLSVDKSTKPEDYYSFNELYAKLMWGSTLKDIAEGNVKSLDTFIAGTGLQFRTLVAAAINWSKYIDALTSQVAKPWLVHLAPDANISGTNQNDSNIKTPRDEYQKVNSLFALDLNLNKISLGEIGDSITPQNNKEAFQKTSIELEQYKSARFEQIKKQMKILLDQFYKDNPQFSQTDKIKFQYFFPFSSTATNVYIQSTRNAIEIIKKLDPRLDLGELQNPTNQGELFKAVWASGSDLSGWGYDVDTIGSGFDGFSWQGNLIPQLFAIGHSESLQNKLQASFPQLVDVSKYLVKYTNEKLKENKITFGELDINKLPEFLLKHQTHTSDDIDANKEITQTGTLSGQFWTAYTVNRKNEELIELAKELTNYLSPTQFDTMQSISSDDFAPFLLHNGYEAPLQQNGIEHYEDWKIKTTSKE